MPSVSPLGYVTPKTPDAIQPTSPFDATQASALRGKLVEIILRQVLAAVFGFFSPAGGTAFTQLTSFFTDFLGIFGNPTGLGSGSVGLGALGSIPILGPIFSLFGGAANVTQALSFFTNLLSFLGGPSLTGGGFDPIAAVTNFITTMVNPLGLLLGTGSPLNAANLFGLLSPNLLGFLPIGQLVNTSQELLVNPGFDGSISISTGGNWTYDSAVGHTSLGSAKALANSVTKSIFSNTISVTATQKITLSAWAEWTGLSYTGSPIQLNVARYLDGSLLGYDLVAALTPSSGTQSWQQVQGTYTVPAGVDTIRIKLTVTSAATAGNVWFDDVSALKSGLIQQGWVSDLVSTFTSVFGVFGGTGTLSELLNAGTNLLSVFNNPILTGATGAFNPAAVVTSFITGQINPLNLLTQSGDFNSLLNNLFDGVSNTSGSTGKTLANVLTAFTGFFGASGTFGSLLNNLFDGASGTSGSTGKTLANVLSAFTGLFTTVGGHGTSLQSLFNNIFDGASGTTGSTGKTVGNVLTALQNQFTSGSGFLVTDGFQNIFNNWFSAGGATGTAAEVATTVAAIRASIAGGYTLQTFTSSNAAWTVPSDLATATTAIAGVIGGGGKGGAGQGGTQSTTTLFGGTGGSSGGYISASFDPSTLGSTVAVVVGAGASTAGTDGGTSSFGSIVTSSPNGNGLANVSGYAFTTSFPGKGGDGGTAVSGTSQSNGLTGGDTAQATGGTGGAGSTSTTGGPAAAGSAGGTGVSGTTPICGGGGGGGGGARRNTAALSTATGGAGGAGGFPGAGSGGGGAGMAGSSGTGTGGAGGTAPNGLVFVLWR